MQHLNEKWLRYLNYYCIGGSSVLLVVYAVFAFEQKTLFITGKEAYGTSITTAAFALGILLYNLLLMRPIKKSSVWLAYAISYLLFALTNNAAVELSLNTGSSPFFLANAYVLIIASTAFGPVVALFAIAIISIVYAMTVTGTTTPTMLGVVGDGIGVLFRMVVVILLIYKFRNKYVTDTKPGNINYIERYFVDNEVVKLLTDSINDGILIIDKEGVVKSVNPGAAQLLLQDRKDILDLNYRSILHFKTLQNVSVNADTEPVHLALAQAKPVNEELILVQKNNEQRFVDLNVSAIANPTTKEVYGAVIILRDVSKKKMEEKERSEFISTASHEMRTPVAAIEGYIGLALNERVSTIDAKAREYLTKAHASTQHLGRLFQDLLVSAKAEDGRLVSHPVSMEVGELLDQLVEEFKLVAGKKNLQLEYIVSANKDGKTKDKHVVKPLYYIHADPDRLREVITNLFDNAVKYTKQGTITVGLTGNSEVVQIFVRDMGIGISADDIPHLFQKFYRVDSSDTRTTGGTGLGLFISRKILELYNGHIWAESELGKGSTFYVNLPRLNSSQISAVAPSVQTVKATTPPPQSSPTTPT